MLTGLVSVPTNCRRRHRELSALVATTLLPMVTRLEPSFSVTVRVVEPSAFWTVMSVTVLYGEAAPSI